MGSLWLGWAVTRALLPSPLGVLARLRFAPSSTQPPHLPPPPSPADAIGARAPAVSVPPAAALADSTAVLSASAAALASSTFSGDTLLSFDLTSSLQSLMPEGVCSL
jgi:hypothetical protein